MTEPNSFDQTMYDMGVLMEHISDWPLHRLSEHRRCDFLAGWKVGFSACIQAMREVDPQVRDRILAPEHECMT